MFVSLPNAIRGTQLGSGVDIGPDAELAAPNSRSPMKSIPQVSLSVPISGGPRYSRSSLNVAGAVSLGSYSAVEGLPGDEWRSTHRSRHVALLRWRPRSLASTSDVTKIV